MSIPPRQARPAPLGVPLATTQIILNDVQSAITDISNATVGVFDSLSANIAICNDLRANGAFQISNAEDAATVGLAVEAGTTSYDLTLPMALPTSTRYLTVDPLGALDYAAGSEGTPWGSSYTGIASGASVLPLGNQSEGRSDAAWVADAIAEGAAVVQQDSTGAVFAVFPAANAASSPPGPAGYAIPAGTSHRTLISPSAVVYRILFQAGYYYMLDGHAFQTIQNYSSLTAASPAAAFGAVPPTGVKGSAVINEDVAAQGYDYAAAVADANALPVALAGYRCYIRGEDAAALAAMYPGILELAWVQTAYTTA